jgi:hypothetical protein
MRGIAARVLTKVKAGPRRGSQLPGMELDVDALPSKIFTGHLMKRARDSGRNWRKRWFVLTRITSVQNGGEPTAVLVYFKNDSVKKSSGRFDMVPGTTVRTTTVDGTPAIVIAPPERGSELYLRAADTSSSLEEWATRLRAEIAACASDADTKGPAAARSLGGPRQPTLPKRVSASPAVPRGTLAGLGAGVSTIAGAGAATLSAPERAQYSFLVEGSVFTKFSKKGGAKSRWVWVSLDLQRLLFSSLGGALSEEGTTAVIKASVLLEEIVSIEERVAWTFKKKTVHAQLDGDLCFDITCTEGRKFSLQAQTLTAKRSWVAALRLWIKRDASAEAFYRWYIGRPKDAERPIGARAPLARFCRRTGVSDLRPLERRLIEATQPRGELGAAFSGAGFLDWLLAAHVVATRAEGYSVGQVSVLLFTVTFHANHAHNLTRSP